VDHDAQSTKLEQQRQKSMPTPIPERIPQHPILAARESANNGQPIDTSCHWLKLLMAYSWLCYVSLYEQPAILCGASLDIQRHNFED
jgi:hypothetical protein